MKQHYGVEKGERVFYASQNAGTITGTHRTRSDYEGASPHESWRAAHLARHGIADTEGAVAGSPRARGMEAELMAMHRRMARGG